MASSPHFNCPEFILEVLRDPLKDTNMLTQFLVHLEHIQLGDVCFSCALNGIESGKWGGGKHSVKERIIVSRFKSSSQAAMFWGRSFKGYFHGI